MEIREVEVDVTCAAATAHSLAFRHAPLGLAVTTGTGVLLHVNDSLCELLGRPAEALLGRSLWSLTHPDDVLGARHACLSVRSAPDRRGRHECRLLVAGGHETPVQVGMSWIDAPEAGADDPQLVLVIEDISARKRVEALLLHQIDHDVLTGLPNRRLFADRLDHALRRAERDATPVCLLVLDLDGFKTINDQHGHAVGDAALTSFATRLSAVLRASDTAARLGGDEFAVLCEDTSPAQAQILIGRLRQTMREPIRLDGAAVTVAFSVGLTHLPGGVPADARTLLADADRSMYGDKRRPR
ncbi:diguanylate cyclase domain-containing protein [Geodermatophilus nigrescens]